MPSRYRALVVLAAGTGLRRTLRVDRQLVLLLGGEPYIAPPKTPASHRTVPLPQIVVDALAAHLATTTCGRPGQGHQPCAGQPGYAGGVGL